MISVSLSLLHDVICLEVPTCCLSLLFDFRGALNKVALHVPCELHLEHVYAAENDYDASTRSHSSIEVINPVHDFWVKRHSSRQCLLVVDVEVAETWDVVPDKVSLEHDYIGHKPV